MAKVLIYTLSWDRLEYTKRCLKAVDELTNYPYDHLVIDQGSTDGSKEWLEKNNKMNILLDENIGIPRAINLVHERYPDYEWYCKLDNDCEVLSDNWLNKMMDAELDPERPKDMVLSPYVKGLVVNKGGVPRGLPSGHPQRFEKYNISFTTKIGGICRLYPKWVWDKFGGFPEDRPKHYDEDGEFTGYWEQNGFYCGYVEDIACLHMDGTLGQQEKYPDYFQKEGHASPIDSSQFKDYVPDF